MTFSNFQFVHDFFSNQYFVEIQKGEYSVRKLWSNCLSRIIENCIGNYLPPTQTVYKNTEESSEVHAQPPPSFSIDMRYSHLIVFLDYPFYLRASRNHGIIDILIGILEG